MKAILDRLDVQLARHVPDLARRLRPPATQTQIAEVEGLLGRPLTGDLRQVYLWHDGALPRDASFEDLGPTLFGPFSRWCSLELATVLWRADKEYWDADVSGSFLDYANHPQFDKGAKLRYWPAVPSAWLCIGFSRTRSRTYVDLAPGAAGAVGQLVDSDGEGTEEVLAPGIREYFEWMATSLESGFLSYDNAAQRWEGHPRSEYFRWV
jgi:cell wall assembly regulator SMI1